MGLRKNASTIYMLQYWKSKDLCVHLLERGCAYNQTYCGVCQYQPPIIKKPRYLDLYTISISFITLFLGLII